MNEHQILPPPATLSDEEPIAAGVRQVRTAATCLAGQTIANNLPPPVTLSDEEPIAAGGR
jgi:hypothetical protein